MEIVKMTVNNDIDEWLRTRVDHAILCWEPPAVHPTEARTVPVSLHDELAIGTPRHIADLTGAP